MSHIAKIEVEINDIDSLKAACKRLGLEFVCDQKTYQWYGTDSNYTPPVPEGLTATDLGHCDHAIRVPNAAYEIGIAKRNGKYILLWDPFERGGLEAAVGKGAGKLKQAYGAERVRKEAVRKGYHVTETRTQTGLRITLLVP